MKSVLSKTYLLLALLYSFTVSAQHYNIDSLKRVLQTQKDDTGKVNTLNLLSYTLASSGDNNGSLPIAENALSLSQKLNYRKGKAYAYSNIANAHVYSGNNYPGDLKIMDTALQIMQEINNQKAIAECYDIISAIYFNQGNSPEELKYMYSALKIYEAMGNKWLIINSLSNIASTNASQGNDSDAFKNFTAALQISQSLHSKSNVAISLQGLADTYYNMANFPEAVRHDSMALRLFEEAKDVTTAWGVPLCYASIGKVYAKEGELARAKGDAISANTLFNESLQNYDSALALDTKSSNAFGVAYKEVKLGNLYLPLNKLATASDYLQKGLQFFTANHANEGLKDAYEGLASLDSMRGNYKNAYEYYRKYIFYRDSLNNNETARKSLVYKMQYESEKKDAAAREAQLKKDAEQLRARNRQYFAIGLLVILTLVFLLIAFIQWRNNKHKQKANKLIMQQKQQVESTLADLKLTQAQLIQSEKMASLGELTAGIAHEIQNPLNFVNNFSEVNTELIDELEAAAGEGNIEEIKTIAKDIKENEEKINHHGRRADAIVKGMLQHSRASTGHKEPTDINALADEYLRLSYHGLRAKDKTMSSGQAGFNATLQTDFDNNIPKIDIVTQDIGRVLLNLFTNAFYAVNEKNALARNEGLPFEPIVSVSTRKVNNTIELTVRDNGNGIPQKITGKIFQPFFTTKPTGLGTGLGLSLSYDIVKAHGGQLKMTTKEGEGAAFTIELPVLNS